MERLLQTGILWMDPARREHCLAGIPASSLSQIGLSELRDLSPRHRRRLLLDAFALYTRGRDGLVPVCKWHASRLFSNYDEDGQTVGQTCLECDEMQAGGVTRTHYFAAHLVARAAAKAADPAAVCTLLTCLAKEDTFVFSDALEGLLVHHHPSSWSAEVVLAVVTVAAREINNQLSLRARNVIRACALELLTQFGSPRTLLVAVQAFIAAGDVCNNQKLLEHALLPLMAQLNSAVFVRAWTQRSRTNLAHYISWLFYPLEGCVFSRSELLTAAQYDLPEVVALSDRKFESWPIPSPVVCAQALQRYNWRYVNRLSSRNRLQPNLSWLFAWIYAPTFRPSTEQVLQWQLAVMSIERASGVQMHAEALGTFYRAWLRVGARWSPQDWLAAPDVSSSDLLRVNPPSEAPATWFLIVRPRATTCAHLLRDFVLIWERLRVGRVLATDRSTLRTIVASLETLCVWQWRCWRNQLPIYHLVSVEEAQSVMCLDNRVRGSVFEEIRWTMAAFNLPLWTLQAKQVESLIMQRSFAQKN